MLARWLLDAGCLAFLQPDLRLILGRSWDIGGHTEGPCEVQAWILTISCWFKVTILGAFEYVWTKKRDFVISITKLFVLMIFEWEFGCLWLQKQAFGNGSIAKINFRRKWISYDSRVDFAWFWVALEAIFMAFVALEAGLKTHDFSWWFWGHPGSWAPGGLRVSWSLFRVCMYVCMYVH